MIQSMIQMIQSMKCYKLIKVRVEYLYKTSMCASDVRGRVSI